MITFSYYFGRWNNLLKTKAFSKMFGYKKPNWTFPKYLIKIVPFSWKMSIKNLEIWSDLLSICNICLWRRLTFCIFFMCISAGVLQWLGYYYNFFIALGNKEAGWILIMNIVLELTRPVNQLNLTVLYWLWLPYSRHFLQYNSKKGNHIHNSNVQQKWHIGYWRNISNNSHASPSQRRPTIFFNFEFSFSQFLFMINILSNYDRSFAVTTSTINCLCFKWTLQ